MKIKFEMNQIKTTATEFSAESNALENRAWLDLVQRHVSSLRFGVVKIAIHENRVMQIERTEKVRLAEAPPV